MNAYIWKKKVHKSNGWGPCVIASPLDIPLKMMLPFIIIMEPIQEYFHLQESSPNKRDAQDSYIF